MVRGGSIFDCDDCGWQACLGLSCCLQTRAAELGVEVQDILETARPLTPAELEQLAAELTPELGR